jgi:hypothetical protein
MLRRVALVRTDVSVKLGASFIKVTRIGELGTTLAVTSNRRTLRRNTSMSETFRYHKFLTNYNSRNVIIDLRFSTDLFQDAVPI